MPVRILCMQLRIDCQHHPRKCLSVHMHARSCFRRRFLSVLIASSGRYKRLARGPHVKWIIIIIIKRGITQLECRVDSLFSLCRHLSPSLARCVLHWPGAPTCACRHESLQSEQAQPSERRGRPPRPSPAQASMYLRGCGWAWVSHRVGSTTCGAISKV